jgi:ectoine hydroxylase-related dioxygenase (phytanoyl-CoA dioxygenase family)
MSGLPMTEDRAPNARPVPAHQQVTQADVAAYRRDGFLFPVAAFTPAEAAGWAREIMALPTPALADHRAPWVQKSYLLLPSLDGLMRDPRLTDAVAAILGEDLLVLSADLFIKAPHTAKKITWHQDVNYWGLEPLEVLTAWVAFTHATPENGCMYYARGGHRARLEHVEHKTEDNMLSRGQEIAVVVDPADVVDVRLSPGQVSFHDGLAPHASGPNTTDATRIGFAIRYSPAHVKQTSGPPISARLARGSDSHGNFVLEEGPDAPLSASALAAHHRALDPHAPYNYSTV